jgi:hypothetical protein
MSNSGTSKSTPSTSKSKSNGHTVGTPIEVLSASAKELATSVASSARETYTSVRHGAALRVDGVAGKLADATEAAGTRAGIALNKSGLALNKAGLAVSFSSKSLSKRIKDHPVAAIGITVGALWLAAKILRR